MIHVKINESHPQVAHILEEVLRGEEVMVTDTDGKVVRLVALATGAPAASEVTCEELASIDDRELNHYLC